MAVLKCKMCGAVLDVAEGATVAVCNYCMTKQTLHEEMKSGRIPEQNAPFEKKRRKNLKIIIPLIIAEYVFVIVLLALWGTSKIVDETLWVPFVVCAGLVVINLVIWFVFFKPLRNKK